MDHSVITYPLRAKVVAEDHHHHSAKASFRDLPLEVLEYILPHLPPQTILSLALVSKAFHHLLFPPTHNYSSSKHTLRPWRHLNLGESYTSPSPQAQKKPLQHPNNLLPPSPPPSPPPTFTPAYIHDPQSLLQKPYILSNIRTLILDGLPSVTVPFLTSLFKSGDCPSNLNGTPLHRIQLLSIRACPKLEDQALARSVLGSLEDIPLSLKAIYYFSDPDLDFVRARGAAVFVDAKMGRMLSSAKRRSENPASGGWWVEKMKELQGRIAFDAEVCRAKMHVVFDDETGVPVPRDPMVASMRVTSACAGCGAGADCEDYVDPANITKRGSGYGDGESLEGGVVFPPAPIHSSSIAVAKSDRHLRGERAGKVTLRCTECLAKRYCRGCGKWWCTPCAERPHQAPAHSHSQEQVPVSAGALERREVVSRDCYECGFLCRDCTKVSARECVNCRGRYCVVHDEQAGEQHCEWCLLSTSHRRGSVSAVARASPGTSPAGRRRSSVGLTSEVTAALSSIAALTDPSSSSSSSSSSNYTFSPPTSPHLTPIPQPVILLSSRLPPATSPSPISSAKPRSKLQPDPSPIMRAMNVNANNPEVHRAAGMRLRTMLGGVGVGVGTGAGGSAGAAAGAGVDRRVRWGWERERGGPGSGAGAGAGAAVGGRRGSVSMGSRSG